MSRIKRLAGIFRMDFGRRPSSAFLGILPQIRQSASTFFACWKAEGVRRIEPFSRRDLAQDASRVGIHRGSAQTLPVASAVLGRLDGSGRHLGTACGSRSRRIRSRIATNSRRGTATSAIWKITYRACVTTFAPILMSFSRSVVSDQRLTERGSASLRRKLPRLYDRAKS